MAWGTLTYLFFANTKKLGNKEDKRQEHSLVDERVVTISSKHNQHLAATREHTYNTKAHRRGVASSNQEPREVLVPFNFFNSMTTTLMLSLLPRDIASSTNNVAASTAVRPLTASGNILAARPLRHCLATLQATWFDTTSHSPSVARIMNSSFSVRSTTVTSGSDITYGLR